MFDVAGLDPELAETMRALRFGTVDLTGRPALSGIEPEWDHGKPDQYPDSGARVRASAARCPTCGADM